MSLKERQAQADMSWSLNRDIMLDVYQNPEKWGEVNKGESFPLWQDQITLFEKQWNQFYEKLIETDELPKTSQITPYRFSEAFENLTKNLEFLKQNFPEVYFSLNFTIIPNNCDKIVDVYDWCHDKGYHVSFQMFVQKKETKQFVWQENALETIENKINIITTKMANECGIKEFNEDTFLQNEGLTSQFLALYYIIKYIKNPKRYFPNCPCGEKYE